MLSILESNKFPNGCAKAITKRVGAMKLGVDSHDFMMEEIFRNLSPHELMTNMVNVCPRFRDIIIGMFRVKFQHSYWKQIKFTEMPY